MPPDDITVQSTLRLYCLGCDARRSFTLESGSIDSLEATYGCPACGHHVALDLDADP